MKKFPFKIRKGCYGGYFAVFEDNIQAEAWDWLFYGLLHRRVASFGSFENSYCLWGK